MNDFPTIVVEKINAKAIIPCKPKSFFDAGWDVYGTERVVIQPNGGDALLSTGLRVAIPEGYCLQVNPRSGKATRDKLVIGARIIDSPYRGELKIHIINFGKEAVEISPNDPCAQLLILRTAGILMEGVVDMNTDRGEDGFGSSNSELIKLAKEARSPETKINDLLDKAEVVELKVSNPEFFATKEGSNKSARITAVVSTLIVLRQRIDQGDLSGTTRELAWFSDALNEVINHLQ